MSPDRVAGPRPRVRTADAVVSAVALILVGAVVAMAVLGGVFLLAFMKPCPAPTCSADGAWTAVGVGLGVAAATSIGGLAISVRRLARGRTAWPFALVTLVVCLAAVVLGWAGYRLATGG